MEKNNKGFTLIEVIVVMAIMAVLVGVGAQMFGLSDTGYIRRASSELKSMIDQAEYNTQAVAAKEWKIEITKEDSSYVARLIKVELDSSDDNKTVETVVDEKQLSGGKKLMLTFDAVLGDGTSIPKQEVSDSVPLTISFEKQSGEVNNITFGESHNSASLKATTATGVGNITIGTTNTSIRSKTINIYWSTGKILMK